MESGKEKIRKICETLRKETLEPAELMAQHLLEEAKKKAQSIIAEAEEESARLIKKAHEEIHKEQRVFQASLSQAATQTLETLRQEIEHRLFAPELEKLFSQEMVKPEIIAELLRVIIKAIEKEGIAANLELIVPKAASVRDVTALLAEGLRGKELSLGDFTGGAKVRIHEKNMSIEITDSALMEIVASYVRKDFREYVFNKHR
jgi:V/A-type H+/Na+-transporting ATPase subunit E